MAGRRSSAAMRKADPGTWVKISCGVVSAPCRTEMPVAPSRPMMPTSIRRPSGVLATTEMMASSGKTTCWIGFSAQRSRRPLQLDHLKVRLDEGQIVRRERQQQGVADDGRLGVADDGQMRRLRYGSPGVLGREYASLSAA